MNNDENEKITKSFVTTCPRCGDRAFEYLRTHNHCVNCLYFEIKPDHQSIGEIFSAEKALARHKYRLSKIKEKK